MARPHIVTVLAVACATACAGQSRETPAPVARPVRPVSTSAAPTVAPATVAQPAASALAVVPARANTSPKAAKPPGIDPKDIARAKKLVEQGLRSYRQGDYDVAEQTLKEAITVYPFLADANLALGKIFLIRASAAHDVALLNSARLMFEMARALDPDAREIAVLLELFNTVEMP